MDVGLPPVHLAERLYFGNVSLNVPAQAQLLAQGTKPCGDGVDLWRGGVVAISAVYVELATLRGQGIYFRLYGVREHGKLRVRVDAVFPQKAKLTVIPLQLQKLLFHRERRPAPGAPPRHTA